MPPMGGRLRLGGGSFGVYLAAVTWEHFVFSTLCLQKTSLNFRFLCGSRYGRQHREFLFSFRPWV